MEKASWADILNGTCKVINLNRNPERWDAVQNTLRGAGFTNIERVAAVDAKNSNELQEAWALFGNPKFSDWDQEFVSYPGKQGCFLSHMKIWKQILDEKLPWVTVFEDDVIFHQKWSELAPQYFEITPKHFDVLYLGAQFEFPSKFHVDCGPVFCTHAMIVTYEGAKKLYDMCLECTKGVYTIDCMIIDKMKYQLFSGDKSNPLHWFVWNGQMYPTEQIHMPKGWTKRNSGLVFQDEAFGSEVRPW